VNRAACGRGLYMTSQPKTWSSRRFAQNRLAAFRGRFQ
jgi:hypothetical protein